MAMKSIILSVVVAVASVLLAYYNKQTVIDTIEIASTLVKSSAPHVNDHTTDTSGVETFHVFSVDELKKHDGKGKSKILYIGLLGKVFDVTKGSQYYGPGGSYEFFTGKDGSRAFVSGDFTEVGLTDDVTGLSHSDYIGLEEWVKFYEKDYKLSGVVNGRYYDEAGNPTAYLGKVHEWIKKAHVHKANEETEKNRFPPCNSEWSQEGGSRVWCSNKSGGIEREWTGVPRRLFNPGHPEPRCACVKDSGAPTAGGEGGNRGDLDNPLLKEYTRCPPTDTACVIFH